MRLSDLTVRDHQAPGGLSTAVYSGCGAYRYALTRTRDVVGPRLLFILLNPSTASETRNDPTVARCERRAWTLGFGAFRVVNLFAWRATDPRALRDAADPVGPRNDDMVKKAAGWADLILCGWGTHGAYRDRGARVETVLRDGGFDLNVLGLTRGGHPAHPLYLGHDRAVLPWPRSNR